MVELIDNTKPALVQDDGEEDYLNKTRWTYDEWLEEVNKPIDQPDVHNKDDPRYYMKYAHNIPPLQSYFFIPEKKD